MSQSESIPGSAARTTPFELAEVRRELRAVLEKLDTVLAEQRELREQLDRIEYTLEFDGAELTAEDKARMAADMEESLASSSERIRHEDLVRKLEGDVSGGVPD